MAAEGCLSLLPSQWKARFEESGQSGRLLAAAAQLPPIPRLGLEVGLGLGGGRIDLHQLIVASPIEQALLLQHLDLHPFHGNGEGSLRRFVETWSDPDRRLAETFPSLFLEFDRPDGASPNLGYPCVFLDVHRRLGAGAQRVKREELTLGLVEEVLVGAGREMPGALRECFQAIPPDASIGHLGFMFGRDDGWLRVNVKQLRRGQLEPFLEQIGWPGDPVAADALFSRLIDQVDRVTVALDLREGWQEGIAFEAFLEHSPARDPRWRRLLDGLFAEGLATEGDRSDLLEFPASLVPGPDGPAWPARWVVGTALAPSDHLPSFRRYLSHVKVSLDPDGGHRAKAYLGLVHEWQVLETRAPSEDHAERDVSVRMDAPGPGAAKADRLEQAIEGALEFLATRITQGGFWRDFHLKVGFGDEWVTAFIASQLLDSGRPEGRELAERAWAWLLRRQRPNGGWGFNGGSPGDADSTAWGLRLAGRLASSERGVDRARAFLATHWLPEGGVSTYARSTPLLFDGERLTADRREGWSGSHDCVTASAASFLAPRAQEHLRQRQGPDGSWRAYWWQSDFLATGLAAEALFHVGPAEASAEDRGRVARAIGWAWSHSASDRSAFDLAWAIRLASLEPEVVPEHRIADTIGQLLSRQLPDGSWPAGAAMLFPRPWQTERSQVEEVCLDQDRCFTTAAVVGALGCIGRVDSKEVFP